jgi:hypothetical protein
MTNSKDQLEIPLSKKKLVLMFIGSLGFVAAGFWFAFNPPRINNPLFGNPIFILAISIAAILFFGFCAVFIARKLPDSRPGLVLDSEGLTDYSSGVSIGKILWSDIEDISIIEIQRQKLIMLQVRNPQDYIEKQTNGLKRKIMQMNWKMYGSPLSITAASLQIQFDGLVDLIDEGLTKSRQ